MTESNVFAYVSVITDRTFAIGVAHLGVHGYSPRPEYGTFESWEAAKGYAETLNAELTLTSMEALNIIATTIYPFDKTVWWPSLLDKIFEGERKAQIEKIFGVIAAYGGA